MPTHKVIHICKPHEPTHKPKLAKEYAFPIAPADRQADDRKEQRRDNSTYPKGGVSCSKDSFVVTQSLVLALTFVVKIATFAKTETVIYHFSKPDRYYIN